MTRFLKILFLVVFSTMACLCAAQVQRGIVRSQSFFTKQSIPLNDVTITLSQTGMSTFSGKSLPPGEFRLTLDALPSPKTFSLKSVRLRRYHLLDRNLIGRRLEYTPNAPLVIIMQNDDELAEYQEKVERNARVGLDKEYQRKISEINRKYQNDIAQRDRQIAQLYDWKIKNEKIIEEYIAEKLETTDFELQDQLTKQVYAALEEGNFAKVDSLNNSNGGLSNELERFFKRKEENKRRMEQEAKENANLIDRLTGQYISCIARNMPDEAYVWLIQRNELAPDRIDFKLDTGRFIEEYRSEYRQALNLYDSALEMARQLYEPESEMIARCLQRKGDVLGSLGQYGEALPLLQQARDILQKLDGKTKDGLCETLLSLGQLHANIGHYRQAESFFKQCMATVGNSNGTVAMRSQLALASILAKSGKYHEGRRMLTQLATRINNPTGDYFLLKAETYQGIIQCLYDEGLINETMDSLKRAMQYVGSIGGDRHISLVNLLVTESVILLNQGDNEGAERDMQRALDIVRSSIGIDNNTYNEILSQISNYYISSGQPAKALTLAQQALERTASLYGREHMLTIPARMALKNAYSIMADMEHAREQLDSVGRIYQKTEIKNELDSIMLRVNEYGLKTGFSKKELNSYIQCLRLAIDKLKETIGPHAVGQVELYSTLAQLYMGNGYFKEAEEVLKVKRDIIAHNMGGDSFAASTCCLQEAQLQILLCDFPKAFSLLQAAEKLAVQIYGSDSYYMINIYGALGDYHQETYDFDKALDYYQRMLDIIERTFGKGHANSNIAFTKLCNYYYATGMYNKAEECARKSYEITRTSLGDDAPQLTMPLIQMATISMAKNEESRTDSLLEAVKLICERHPQYTENLLVSYNQLVVDRLIAKGDNKKAEQVAREIIDNTLQKYDGNRNILALSYFLLSKIHAQTGDYDLAAEEVGRELQLKSEIYGPESPQTLQAILNCEKFYVNILDMRNAWKYCNMASQIMEKSLGKKHLFNLPVKRAKAHLEHIEGNHQLALKIYKEVLAETERQHFDNKLEIASIIGEMAPIYGEMGIADSAMACYRQYLNIYENHFGPDSPALVNILQTMGIVSMNDPSRPPTESMAEARGYFRRALKICRKHMPADSPVSLMLQMYLDMISVQVATDFESYDKGFKLWRKSLQRYYDAVCKEAYRPDFNYNVLIANQMMAVMLMQANLIQEAMPYLDKAIAINDNVFGKDHVRVITLLQSRGDIQWMMAAASYNQNATEQADSLKQAALSTYRKAADILLSHYGENTPNVLPAYALMAKVYKAEKDYTKLTELLDKSIDIYKRSYTGPKDVPDPRAFDCRMEYYYIYMEDGDSLRALTHISSLLDDALRVFDDNNARLMTYRMTKAILLVSLHKDLDTARQLLDEVWATLETSHNTASETGCHAKFFTALIYLDKHDFTDAIKCLEEVLRLAYKAKNFAQHSQFVETVNNLIEVARNQAELSQ